MTFIDWAVDLFRWPTYLPTNHGEIYCDWRWVREVSKGTEARWPRSWITTENKTYKKIISKKLFVWLITLNLRRKHQISRKFSGTDCFVLSVLFFRRIQHRIIPLFLSNHQISPPNVIPAWTYFRMKRELSTGYQKQQIYLITTMLFR